MGAEIEWVHVGDPNNPADPAGRGSVPYAYQIAKGEVTVEQYVEFLNAVAAHDPHELWNPKMGVTEYRITEPVFAGRVPPRMPGCIRRLGDPGSYRYEAAEGWEKKPVVYVSFLDAMRFANWLHHGKGSGETETGAYDISKAGGLAAHGPEATVWVTTEDEWIKAAYYQPQEKGGPEGGYWLYPTRSQETPRVQEPGSTETNLANFFNLRLPGSLFADYTRIAATGSYPNSPSYYGTLDQGGNVSEWTEAVVFQNQRPIRGGSVGDAYAVLQRVTRISSRPEKEYPDTGFRMARRPPSPAGPAAQSALRKASQGDSNPLPSNR
ncbi:MAG: hypothetical protein RLZZ142_1903 [Verrucomicrobiota bacterium]|jgi:formylglycine-generating enzyme required for sulfatase activity